MVKSWFYLYPINESYLMIKIHFRHPRCGPGPTENLNGVLSDSNGHYTDTEADRMSNSAMSELQVKLWLLKCAT